MSRSIKALESLSETARFLEFRGEILYSLGRVAECLRERHEESMIAEDGSMKAHRKEEPGCDYCDALREAESLLAKADRS